MKKKDRYFFNTHYSQGIIGVILDDVTKSPTNGFL